MTMFKLSGGPFRYHLKFSDLFLDQPLNVGDLLLWQEIHPGLDVETWAWCENGLGCIQNGLVCVVRYQ